MLYQNYKQKMTRVADVLSTIKRFRVLICAVLLVILAAIISMLSIKGIIYDSGTCPEEIVYGQTLNYQGKAIFGKVTYEYAVVEESEGGGTTAVKVNYSPTSASSEDGEVWTTVAPTRAGKYKVRCVSTNIFGKRKYGEEHTFSILKKEVTVKAADSVVYGELPQVVATTEYGDSAVCTQFEYDDLSLNTTQIIPVENCVAIYDTNGEDVTSSYTIKVESSQITFTPRQIDIVVADKTGIYDGNKLTSDTYKLSEDTPLVANDKIIATFADYRIDVGTSYNTPQLQVVNENGDDVTVNYAFNITSGKLTIERRKINISSSSDSKIYDGESLVCTDFTVDNSTPQVQGQSVLVKGYSAPNEVGTYNNTLTFSLFDEDGNETTDNYLINLTQGTLTITKRQITVLSKDCEWGYDGLEHTCKDTEVDGFTLPQGQQVVLLSCSSIRNVGEETNTIEAAIYDGNSDKSANYDISYDFGTLTVTKRQIGVIAQTYAKEYDGTPLYGKDVFEYGGSLADSTIAKQYSVSGQTSGSITNVGTVNNPVVEGSVTICDNLGEDVTYCYDISYYDGGTLTIFARDLQITSDDATKVYDGRPLTCSTYNVTGGSIAVGQTITQIDCSGSRTEVGISQNTIAGAIINDGENDVTSNYQIEYLYGTLKVTIGQIIVTTGGEQKVYDGTPLTCADYTVNYNQALKDKLQIQITCTGTITDVGEVDNTFDMAVYDSDGNDMEGFYTLMSTLGKLKVVAMDITVTAGSDSKVYDGKPLTCEKFEISDLPLGHTPTVTVSGSQTKVGESDNIITKCTITFDDRDVTSNFNITLEKGTLTVTPREGGDNTGDGSGGSGGSGDNTGDGSGGSGGGSGGGTGGGSGGGGSGGSGGTGGGSGDLDTSGSLGGSGLEDDNDGEAQVALRLYSDKTGRVYLKLMSYGDMVNNQWQAADEYNVLIDNKYSFDYLFGIALKNAGVEASQIKLDVSGTGYYLPYYLSTTDGDYLVQTSDVYFTGSTDEIYSLYYYLYDYTLDGKVEGALSGQLSNLEQDYRQFVYTNYLSVPQSTKVYLLNLIKEQGFDINDPDIIAKIATYIQNAAEYNLKYDKQLDSESDVVVSFLSTYKQGVCRHYASAATLLFRTLGIPARYTIGYLGYTTASEWTDVTTEQAHAWVEVYLDGLGWVQVEVTGSSPSEGKNGDMSQGDMADPSNNQNLPETITVKPADEVKKADGTPLTATQVEVNVELQYLKNLGYTWQATFGGSQTEVGESQSTVENFVLYDNSGNDITSYYKIIFAQGTLRVTNKDVVVIHPYSYQYTYDGLPHAYEDDDFYTTGLPSGYTIVCNLSTISITDVGAITKDDLQGLVVVIYNAQGVVVTDDYEIDYDYAVGADYFLRVDRRSITINTKNASKVYDGTRLVCNDYWLVGSLVEGHSLVVNYSGYIIDIGTADNKVGTWDILDKYGKSVADNYNVDIVCGKLTIESE